MARPGAFVWNSKEMRASFSGKKSGFSVGRRARLGARDIAAKPERVKLAIERRAPDFQPPRDFLHLPAVMREREADDLGLDVLERTHLATAVDQA